MTRPLASFVALLAIASAARAQPATRPAAPDVALVRAVVAEITGVRVDEVLRDTTFATLRIDELDLVEIVMELEDRTGLSIPDERIAAPSPLRNAPAVPPSMTPAKLAAILQAIAKEQPTTRPAP